MDNSTVLPLSSYTMAETFRLPDLLAMSPWQTGPVNPHLEDEGKASMQWALGYVYDIVKTKHRLEFFEKGQGGLLCAWVYPYASADKFRICCDIMYLVFAVDEFTDVQGGGDAQATMDSVIATFSEDSHDDDSALCLMTREYVFHLCPMSIAHLCFPSGSLKARFLTRCAPIAARRFMHHMLDYLRSVGQEVEHRDKQMLFSVEEYQSLRRDTAGARYSLDLIEFIHDIELPDDIFNHPAIVNVYLAVVDMVCWSNVSTAGRDRLLLAQSASYC